MWIGCFFRFQIQRSLYRKFTPFQPDGHYQSFLLFYSIVVDSYIFSDFAAALCGAYARHTIPLGEFHACAFESNMLWLTENCFKRASGAAVLFVKGCMSAGVTLCLPPACAVPCRVRASVCACRSSSISISYSLPNSGQYARPALKRSCQLDESLHVAGSVWALQC